jgi:hypothetical protein
MSAITTFDSTKEALLDLLTSVKAGRTQLPDFQRGWVWDDERVRSLLASIALSYPIGAVMMLQTGNPDVRFKPRLVEGVELAAPPEPERLILDGQQRLTSLFQSLYSGHPVETRDNRGKTIKRWYYLDIRKALDPLADIEDAIISLPETRILKNFRGEVEKDYSTPEKECEAELMPLPLVFDNTGLMNWQFKYVQSVPERFSERMEHWSQLLQVIQRFQQYQLPVIVLRKETPKEAVCQVFEKVNTGGVQLNVFELLTATYAADDYNLREDWAERLKRFKASKLLQCIENTDFLQAISLLATRARRLQAIAEGDQERAPAISCKRKDVLRLTLDDYRSWADPVTEGLEKAARLLHAQNIFAARDLPYRTQLVPLAAMFAVLGDRGDTYGVKEKLAQWYWCGVFGELYGGSIETRFAKDLPEVLDWINGGPDPATIVDANFAPVRLLSLRTRNSAAYKGIYAITMRDGGLDFRTGTSITDQVYFDDSIDIHHIFPQHWCRNEEIEPKFYDSIVNKTALSAKTNRIIGGKAPSKYLPAIQQKAGVSEECMDVILQSHLIQPELIRADDFQSFFAARENALLERIEKAMGKAIARDSHEALEPESEVFEEELTS